MYYQDKTILFSHFTLLVSQWKDPLPVTKPSSVMSYKDGIILNKQNVYQSLKVVIYEFVARPTNPSGHGMSCWHQCV